MAPRDQSRRDSTPSHPIGGSDRSVRVKILVSSQPQARQRRKPDPPDQTRTDSSAEFLGDRPTVRVLVSSQSRQRQRPQRPSPIKVESQEEPLDQGWDDELDDELDLEEPDDRPQIRVLASPDLRRSRGGLSLALLTLAVWVGIASAVVVGGWVAFRMIINPGSISWMQWMVPEWNRNPLVDLSSPQTMGRVREQAKQAGLFLGEPFPLGDTGALVVPVSAEIAPCSGLEAIAHTRDCGAITELRVYRPYPTAVDEGLFELVDRLAIPGLQEYFVVAAANAIEGSSQLLPLTAVSVIDGKAPQAGIWFQVSGEWVRGSTHIVYGQIMSYAPARSRLETMLQWTSPAGELPQWQEIGSDRSPELVVNQTLGLEPDFKVYRVKPPSSATHSVALLPITLNPLSLKSQTYTNALTLARGGLWTPAFTAMQAVKARRQRQPSGWSAAAQAQLEVIQLHSVFTKAQAERVWASPSEQITALIIEGRWTEALNRFRTAYRDGYDITTLLRDDAGVIWRRVNATLTVDRRQVDVQAWGALIVTMQQGKRAAIAWLQSQQPRSTVASHQPVPVDSRLQDILNLLGTLPQTDANSTHTSRLLGTVSRLSRINAGDWTVTQLNTRLTLASPQVWYQIQVTRFHDGQRWWRSPFTALNLPMFGVANDLWDRLGLSANPHLQILVWGADGQSQTVSATVKAMRFQNNRLQLLAAGEPFSSGSSPVLAMTTDTLRWLEPTSTLSLSDLHQQQPTWAAALLTALGQELRQTGQVPSDAVLDSAAILRQLGTGMVQLIDLTGNQQPDAIFTVQPTFLGEAKDPSAASAIPTRPRTLIFSDRGRLIYSDLNHEDQAMVAIAALENGSPTLIITTPQTFLFKQWSSQNQRFE